MKLPKNPTEEQCLEYINYLLEKSKEFIEKKDYKKACIIHLNIAQLLKVLPTIIKKIEFTKNKEKKKKDTEKLKELERLKEIKRLKELERLKKLERLKELEKPKQ